MKESSMLLDLPSLGSTMKAIRFHGCGDLRLDELNVADPKPGEVRLRPLAAGLCGTDAHIVRCEFPAASPIVLGHEVAGVVDAVGTGVMSVEGRRPGHGATEHLLRRLPLLPDGSGTPVPRPAPTACTWTAVLPKPWSCPNELSTVCLPALRRAWLVSRSRWRVVFTAWTGSACDQDRLCW